ncbi:MAG: 2-amino-4-hydroxy-6-hydroxymethyldihydropteridine diphosphokinase, partial [Verrucomicrobiota bacterium]
AMEYQGDLYDLLLKTQGLEEQAGRENKTEQIRNAPRPLDLDILFYGQQQLNHHQLILPHPRMMVRLFVLEPLAELVPDYRPYPDQPTIAERVEELKQTG